MNATNLWNFLAFQVGWFACVLGAARGRPWLGPLVCVPICVIHLLGFADIGPELQFLTAMLIGGSLVSVLEERLQLLRLPAAGRPYGGLPPLWISALWVLFGTTFHRSLGWLEGQLALAFVLGLVGGPLSYQAGARLGAVQVVPPRPRSLVLLGLIWGSVVSGAVYLSGWTAPPGGPS